MKLPAVFSCFLLLSGTVATAQEDSFLARLEAETVKMAEAARRAVVIVEAPAKALSDAPFEGGIGALLGRQDLTDVQRTVVALGRATASRSRSLGVLVGSPAMVVAPHRAAGEVSVRFADGESLEAKHLASDAELGISVYALPEEREGLEVDADWTRLAPGVLAVVAGGDLDLVLVREVEQSLGRVRGPTSRPGALLIGRGGRLIGIQVSGTGARAASFHPALADVYLARGRTFAYSTAQAAPGDLYLAGPVLRRVLDDVAEHGRVRRGYMGIVFGEVIGATGREGIPVTAVLDGSPAQAAGLKTGMRIRAIEGVSCEDAGTLSRVLALHRPGEVVTLSVNDSDELAVTLGDRSAAQAKLMSEESLGMTCIDVGPELRLFLGLEEDAGGVAVRDVRHGSLAAHAGLRRGDVIVWGGDGAVADLEELRAAIAAAKESVTLRVSRNGETREVMIRLPEARTSTR